MRLLSYLVVLLLSFAASTGAQTVVEINGGASNAFGSGGNLTLFGNSEETRIGVGVGSLNGHVVYNASQRFEYRGWGVDVGDTQFAVTSGQMFLVAPVRGLALIKKQKHGELNIFTGAVGDVFSSPYFFGIKHAKLGAGFSYKHDVGGGLTLGTIQAATVSSKTSLADLDWKPSCQIGAPRPPLAGAGALQKCWWKYFEFKGQGGVLQNNRQVSGTANFGVPHFSATANRATFIFAPQPGIQPGITTTSLTPVQRITVNSGSAYTGFGPVSGSASVFESSLSTGKAYSGGLHAGWFQVQVSDFASRSKGKKQTGQFLTTSERIGFHLALMQYASKSNGQWNYNAGVSFSSNRFSAQVGYSVLYFPALPQAPFQKVLSVNLGLRLHSSSVSVGTVALPNGRVQWNVGGNDYVSTPLSIPAIPGATAADIRSLPSRSRGGRYVITGFVVDDKGAPVEGACIQVNGSDPVFTDSTGHFSVQEKHKDVPIHVDTENFMQGDWQVVEAPATAHAGELVHIVVKRK